MTRLYYGCCLGPAWFRIPSWLGLASPGSNAQFIGIIPPIVCINVAIRTDENKQAHTALPGLASVLPLASLLAQTLAHPVPAAPRARRETGRRLAGLNFR